MECKRLKINVDEKSIQHLPPEILLRIFYFMRGEEIKNVKLVCKQWYNTAQAPEIGSKLKLTLTHINFPSSTALKICDALQKSCQKFYHIHLKQCNVEFLIPLLKMIGKYIRTLNLEELVFTVNSKLLDILSNTKYIEELKIINCSFHQCDNFKNIDSLHNVKVLKIVNTSISKTNYAEIIHILRNISENTLNSFSLNYVYKVFRQGNSASIVHLAEMIGKNKNLKKLSLLNCCFDKHIHYNFWELLSSEGQCNLTKFSISHISQISGLEKFIKFLTLQNNLSYLVLNNVYSLNDSEIELISKALNKLKHIELIDCIGFTDKGLITLSTLQELEDFYLEYSSENTDLQKVSIASLSNGIAQTKNYKIKCLSLCNIEMRINEFHSVIQNFPNLRKLKCYSSNMRIQNESSEILKILSNCRYIEDLSFVNYCISNNTSIEVGVTINNTINTLEMSHLTSLGNLLRIIKLPNLKTLKIFHHHYDVLHTNIIEIFLKVLNEVAPLIETIKLAAIDDIDTTDTTLDYILINFKNLRSLSFIWYCDYCVVFKRIHIKVNQKLHPLLKNTLPENLDFDQSCEKCQRLFTKVIKEVRSSTSESSSSFSIS